MGDDTEYNYKTWDELFNFMHYCYENQYGVDVGIYNGIEYVTIYKGTFTAEGKVEYKGQIDTFDPVLWPKVKLFGKLFEEGGTVDVLFGDNNE